MTIEFLVLIYLIIGFVTGMYLYRKENVSWGICISTILFWFAYAITLFFIILEDVVSYTYNSLRKKRYSLLLTDVKGKYDDININIITRMSKKQYERYLKEEVNSADLYIKHTGIVLEEGETLGINFKIYDDTEKEYVPYSGNRKETKKKTKKINKTVSNGKKKHKKQKKERENNDSLNW